MKNFKIPYIVFFVLGSIVMGIAFGMVAIYFLSQPASTVALAERTTTPGTSAAATLEEAFTSIAEQVKPTVVNISSEKIVKRRYLMPRLPDIERFFRFPFGEEEENPFDFFFGPEERNEPITSLGSGVVVPDGYILTNAHLVEGMDKVIVTFSFDKQKYTAKVIGYDSESDLAVIKVDKTNLPAATLGDSDQLKVGSWAMAIGQPFGLEQTVTVGVISAKGRHLPTGEFSSFQDFLQTDASINPGNSGGPLVNLRGEVIGINTAIISPVGTNIGIGFAVPINAAKKIYPQLIEHGKIVRGWLGINIKDLTPELAKYYGIKEGVLIDYVYPDSPAEKGGLKVEDIIVEFNQQKVKTADELQQVVAATGVNKKVPVKIIRDQKEQTIYVTTGERPTPPTEAAPEEAKTKLGMTVRELTPELARQFGLPPDKTGVVVTAIEPGTPAYEAGVRAGFIIKTINRIKIATLADYNRAVGKIKPGDTIGIVVEDQKGISRVLAITVEEK